MSSRVSVPADRLLLDSSLGLCCLLCQVDGDADTDEEEEMGMGNIDVESGPQHLDV